MTEREFIKIYDSGEEFTEKDLASIRWDLDYTQVAFFEGRKDFKKNLQETRFIFQIENRYFELDFMQGLTYDYEDVYEDEPFEVEPYKVSYLDYNPLNRTPNRRKKYYGKQ